MSSAGFDVASIKRAALQAGGEGGNRARIAHTPQSLTMRNVTLVDCVEWAYDVPHFRISAPRASLESYDIGAKTGTPASVAELRAMLQDLLAKRFQLVTHRESRMFPVYELVAAKGGPKLPAAKEGVTHAAESLPRIQGDSFVFADVTIAEFARMFSQLRGIDLPVVDRTGIPGKYDLVLKSAPGAAREGDSAALMALIQEQLGLRLVAAKAAFEVVVIDRAERPSAN
jgi:uncharacterized protein (TIGR03435 family)